jgi:hypothetical protein
MAECLIPLVVLGPKVKLERAFESAGRLRWLVAKPASTGVEPVGVGLFVAGAQRVAGQGGLVVG